MAQSYHRYRRRVKCIDKACQRAKAETWKDRDAFTWLRLMQQAARLKRLARRNFEVRRRTAHG